MSLPDPMFIFYLRDTTNRDTTKLRGKSTGGTNTRVRHTEENEIGIPDPKGDHFSIRHTTLGYAYAFGDEGDFKLLRYSVVDRVVLLLGTHGDFLRYSDRRSWSPTSLSMLGVGAVNSAKQRLYHLDNSERSALCEIAGTNGRFYPSDLRMLANLERYLVNQHNLKFTNAGVEFR